MTGVMTMKETILAIRDIILAEKMKILTDLYLNSEGHIKEEMTMMMIHHPQEKLL